MELLLFEFNTFIQSYIDSYVIIVSASIALSFLSYISFNNIHLYTHFYILCIPQLA